MRLIRISPKPAVDHRVEGYSHAQNPDAPGCVCGRDALSRTERGDFRVRYDFQNRHVPAYNQVVGMQVDGTGTPTGMPLFIPVGEQDLKNAEAWSARLRL